MLGPPVVLAKLDQRVRHPAFQSGAEVAECGVGMSELLVNDGQLSTGGHCIRQNREVRGVDPLQPVDHEHTTS